MLKAILDQHSIQANDLARAIKQTGGRREGQPFGPAAISRLINHGEYPKATPQEEVQEQIEAYLKGRGVPLAELEGLWPAAATAGQGGQNNASTKERTSMIPDAQALSREAKKAYRLAFNPFEGFPANEETLLTDPMTEALEAFYEASQLRVLRAVVGESGSGKTTLKRLFRQRQGQHINLVEVLVTAMADTTRHGGKILPSTQIHTAIIRKLAGDDTRIPGDGQKRQALLMKCLLDTGNKGCLVFIDEAHDLPWATLSHLKRLHELAEGQLGIVLLGQLPLKHKLTPRLAPDIKEAGQRFPISLLPPLEPDEIADYLAARLGRCGVALDAVFEPDAPSALHEHLQRREQVDRRTERTVSESYPLAVGNLATLAINLCARATGGAERIGAAWVAAAAREVA